MSSVRMPNLLTPLTRPTLLTIALWRLPVGVRFVQAACVLK